MENDYLVRLNETTISNLRRAVGLTRRLEMGRDIVEVGISRWRKSGFKEWSNITIPTDSVFRAWESEDGKIRVTMGDGWLLTFSRKALAFLSPLEQLARVIDGTEEIGEIDD